MTERVAPEELVARHSASEHYSDVPGGEDRCAVCFELAPCSPYRAALYIEKLEGEKERLRAVVVGLGHDLQRADVENERLRAIETAAKVAVEAWADEDEEPGDWDRDVFDPLRTALQQNTPIRGGETET